MQHVIEGIGHKPASAAGPDRVPVLDLGPYLAGQVGALDRLAAELEDALLNVGFYYVKNHGVPTALVERVFGEGRRFHALPLDEKLKIRLNRSLNGYMPTKASSDGHSRMNRNPAPNENASFFCHRERDPEDPDVKAERDFRGPNQWPDLPGFKETVLEYQAAMEALARRMLPVFARALDLPLAFFPPFFDGAEVTVRLLHYAPATPDHIAHGVFGHGAHTDRGFMTFLAQANVPGLELLTTSGEWVVAPILPGTFLVNSGDALRRWTNDRFLSTPHRVLNRSATDRYTVVFFYAPNLNSVIDCVPSCQGPGDPPRHEPIRFEDFKRAFSNAYFHNRMDKAAGA